MATSGQPVGHSGKLSNNTIFQYDNDDLMAMIWELTKEKEKIQEEIDNATMEMDGWLQILDCSSAPELNQFIDDFASTPSILPSSFTIIHPSAERDRLAEFCKVVTLLSAHDMLDCTRAYKTEEGDLLIKFPWRPPNQPNHDYLVLLTPGPDHTYSVSSHNLPPTVPLDDLVKEYLQKPQGVEGVHKFVAVVNQYARPFYLRLQQIMALETSGLILGSVKHNMGATNLNFIVKPNLKDHPLLLVEFVLKFHPMDILPHTVTAGAFSMSTQEQIPAGLQVSLDEVARHMKTTTFPQVLLELPHRRRAADPSPSTESTQQEPSTPSSTPTSDVESFGPLFDIGV